MHLLILILVICSIIGLIIYLYTNSNENFFSLSGALYGPRHIPDSEKCPCTQLLGSNQLLSKAPMSINACASCHLN